MRDFLESVQSWFLSVTGITSATDEESIVTALLLIVVTGLVGGVAAKKLRQPLILGYILAGVLVGLLFRDGFRAANSAVRSLANVGVALLLFSMGLEFSRKDLRPVFKVAVFGALAQVVFTFLLATGIAWLLSMDPAVNGGADNPLFGSNVSLFLFGICFVSTSTAVVLKTLSSKGFENSLSGRVMIGVSIVQDLTVMPLMLLVCQLGQLSSPSGGGGVSALMPLLLNAAFMALMLTAGARYLPKVTEHAARLESKELFLLSITGIALVSGAVSVLMQVSFSFGAFLAGIVLSDSAYGRKALSELSPVRDFFAMLFFVSIGMMLDVHYLATHWPVVAALVLLTGFARTVFLSAVTWVFKYRNVIPVAMLFGMFPTSEIAFVVIGTGQQDGFISSDLYSLILSVVVCSMIAGPLVNNLTTPVYSLLRKTIWKNVRRTDVVLPQPDLDGHMALIGGGRVSRVIAHVLIRLKLKYVIVEPSYDSYCEARNEGLNVIYGDPMSDVILAAAHIGQAKVLAPMIPKIEECLAVIRQARKLNPSIRTVMCAVSPETEKRLSEENVDEIILSHFEVSLELTRRILALNGISEAHIQNYLDSVRASRYRPMTDGSPAFALAEKIRAFQGLIELHWTQIQPDSPLAGRSIGESGIRARTGVSVVGVIREGEVDANPRPDTVLRAGDLIAAIGNAEQSAEFARLARSALAASPESAATMAGKA